MGTQQACTACRIIRKEIPAYIIDEDAHIIVFLSLENHPMVVPKTHIPDIFALDEATGALILQAAIRVANAVKAGLQYEGVYLTQANGAAAGQDLLHFHLHVYPRWHDEKLTAYWNTAQADRELRRLTAERIRTHVAPGAGVVPPNRPQCAAGIGEESQALYRAAALHKREAQGTAVRKWSQQMRQALAPMWGWKTSALRALPKV